MDECPTAVTSETAQRAITYGSGQMQAIQIMPCVKEHSRSASTGLNTGF
ncbi:hypothetical protein OESDEN_16275 [Oesophagostomum dentatum]|uniref:Uncharacterized protein n=1 Tax=Oesophagostomum dentatum TaxID=61180 RepID=A0A0B1SJF4_OESDE|nr:hypothetical protein OESDEN_16275 [Oesophagostomum dentatum]